MRGKVRGLTSLLEAAAPRSPPFYGPGLQAAHEVRGGRDEGNGAAPLATAEFIISDPGVRPGSIQLRPEKVASHGGQDSGGSDVAGISGLRLRPAALLPETACPIPEPDSVAGGDGVPGVIDPGSHEVTFVPETLLPLGEEEDRSIWLLPAAATAAPSHDRPSVSSPTAPGIACGARGSKEDINPDPSGREATDGPLGSPQGPFNPPIPSGRQCKAVMPEGAPQLPERCDILPLSYPHVYGILLHKASELLAPLFNSARLNPLRSGLCTQGPRTAGRIRGDDCQTSESSFTIVV